MDLDYSYLIGLFNLAPGLWQHYISLCHLAGKFRFQTETTRKQTSNTKTLKTLKYCQFSRFWDYSDMLGIKKHVLELWNSMVASDKSFELNQKN